MNLKHATNVEQLLSYLSDCYNKSLSLYEWVVSDPKRPSSRAIISLNELFTLYHTSLLFYSTTKELHVHEIAPFLNSLEVFYVEIKQIILTKETNTAYLYQKLSEMKDLFEQITDTFNVL